MWRLLQFPMDQQSHTIIRLAVHLTLEQPVREPVISNLEVKRMLFLKLIIWLVNMGPSNMMVLYTSV